MHLAERMGIDNATPPQTKPQLDETAKTGQSGAQSGNPGSVQKTGAKGKDEPQTEDDGKPTE